MVTTPARYQTEAAFYVQQHAKAKNHRVRVSAHSQNRIPDDRGRDFAYYAFSPEQRSSHGFALLLKYLTIENATIAILVVIAGKLIFEAITLPA